MMRASLPTRLSLLLARGAGAEAARLARAILEAGVDAIIALHDAHAEREIRQTAAAYITHCLHSLPKGFHHITRLPSQAASGLHGKIKRGGNKCCGACIFMVCGHLREERFAQLSDWPSERANLCDRVGNLRRPSAFATDRLRFCAHVC